MNYTKYILPLLLLILMSGCSKDADDLDFHQMANFTGGDTVYIDMDMHDVVNKGIVIPSMRQCDEGAFVFSFRGEAGKYYKIYYQNESYKFDNDNNLNHENFYGSWEDVGIEFKKIEHSGTVYDTFRIVGNPRDERKFYGKDMTENPFSSEKVNAVAEGIKNSSKLHKMVEEKAAANNISFERQLQLDAIWVINNEADKGDFNNRWKRNPRVGCYSFMLVVCDENALRNIPDYIKNIGKTNENGEFVNPYAYFAKNKIKGVDVIIGKRVLKTRAVITPEYGLYLDDSLSSNSQKLYSEALFKQYFNDVSKQFTLRNIPVIQDVVSDDDPYTMAQYEANKTRFDSTQLIYGHPVISDEPGKTVWIDESDNSLVLVNPGNDDINNLRKESTGVRTRVGMTYGKYRGKIKFPVMLNDENIWNGLTYAFWLVYQNDHQWNNRRWSRSGYISKNDNSPYPERLHDYHYSEIDIEIVKAVQSWPDRYKRKEIDDAVTERGRHSSDVMFSCTNWDLASRDPKNFSAGITDYWYKQKKYEAMRWTELYKALTIKTPISNDVFKEDYYYYEIEWCPKEIIWRIGPSPDKMKVVGYMNDEYTCIPNNQMECIVTQEYHYADWWPPVVFWQGLIPYNKTAIKGKVFEIVIE